MENQVSRYLNIKKIGLVIQFIKYSLVGAIASILDILVFYISFKILKVNHIFSNSLSFSCGILLNYFFCQKWVFKVKEGRSLRDFILFVVIGVMGLIISDAILFTLIDCGLLYKIITNRSDDMTKLAAKLLTIVIVLFWNFAARRKLVFKTT